MHADAPASSWDAFAKEYNRWERLRDVVEKLRIVLTTPALEPRGPDDLLEQLEGRLDEAARLFPQPDWLAVDQEGPRALEGYCGNHLGGLLDVLSLVVTRLAELRAAEIASGTCSGGEAGDGAGRADSLFTK